MRPPFVLLALVSVCLGCGQDPAPDAGEDGDSGGIGQLSITEGRTTSDTGDGSQSGSGTAQGGDATTGSVDDGSDDGPLKFDLPPPSDTAPIGCSDRETFSHIWIANTAEGTVSKIDTKTGVELGRYATGPHYPAGSPSRTSVNQFGDAVVVNREPGGIAKVAALEADCVDADGSGTIETSSGGDDVLPWGADECVLWYTDVPSVGLTAGPRPVAWEGVAVDDNGCTEAEPRVWMAYRDEAESGIVWRLDGVTGAVLDEVQIPNWGSGGQRPYGGAVNAEGDFWITGKAADSRTVRIDAVTLDWEDHHDAPASTIYGMAVDQFGHVWAGASGEGAAYHYDPGADAWTVIDAPNIGRIRGLQIDRDGFAWGAANNPCALVKIDTTTETLVSDEIELPGCNDPVGVSIDGDGYVWVVDRQADRAYKVDPDTHDIELTVDTLNEPYTYSDMTGNGLALVIDPPG